MQRQHMLRRYEDPEQVAIAVSYLTEYQANEDKTPTFLH